jgi:hypothetical protein
MKHFIINKQYTGLVNLRYYAYLVLTFKDNFSYLIQRINMVANLCKLVFFSARRICRFLCFRLASYKVKGFLSLYFHVFTTPPLPSVGRNAKTPKSVHFVVFLCFRDFVCRLAERNAKARYVVFLCGWKVRQSGHFVVFLLLFFWRSVRRKYDMAQISHHRSV